MRRGLGRGPRSLDGAGRLFSLIECYQSVAARNISAPLLSRVRAADLCPRGAAPFARAAWHQQATTGCPAAFIRRTARMAARRRRFQFYIERVQSVRRLFLQLRNFATLSFLRLACRSRARSAARPCTTSCGYEASEPIPFPGADSIFSTRCGAISGRLRYTVGHSRAAIPATETPRFKRSRIGSTISAEMAATEQI